MDYKSRTEAVSWAKMILVRPRFQTLSQVNAARAIVAMDLELKREWLSIETAPRDGTRILCDWGHGNGPKDYEICYFDADKGCWRGPHDNYAVGEEPPNWQPLPSPPTTSIGDATQRPNITDAIFDDRHGR